LEKVRNQTNSKTSCYYSW